MGIGEFLNCILVDKDVRSAMLIQPQDYGEATGKDPKTNKILNATQHNFPRLKQSHSR